MQNFKITNSNLKKIKIFISSSRTKPKLCYRSTIISMGPVSLGKIMFRVPTLSIQNGGLINLIKRLYLFVLWYLVVDIYDA